MGNHLTTLKRRFKPRKGGQEVRQLTPKQLAAHLLPLYTELFRSIGYTSAPSCSDEKASELLALMHEKAVEYGVPLDSPVSVKGFRLGYSEGALAYPEHPVEVQAYIALWTWIVVQIDDVVNDIKDAVDHFQQRFFSGEPQPHPLLHAMGELLREAYDYWDPVLANILVTSALNFLTSTLLETREGFQKMTVTKAGTSFPYYYRDLTGLAEAFAIFGYPTAVYPEIQYFLEAIPDMAVFINTFNDVISFYKEELANDDRNYIHNRAMCEEKEPLIVLKDVKREVEDCVARIRAILKGRGIYAESWEMHMRGHIAMHTTNPRYRLAELGLGEKHPFPEESLKKKLEQ
ncbi:hypothetical protein DL770_000194 [Monosporascus sp. CRB-9-2]|nr:hypothetical protein DL770_000194 [Monosporascus sp. CRB-9-2]